MKINSEFSAIEIFPMQPSLAFVLGVVETVYVTLNN